MNKKAFTLIELIIALSIIVGMACLCYPKISGMLSNQQFKYKVGEVVTRLKKTRLESIKTGKIIKRDNTTFYPNGTMSNNSLIVQDGDKTAIIKTSRITGIKVYW